MHQLFRTPFRGLDNQEGPFCWGKFGARSSLSVNFNIFDMVPLLYGRVGLVPAEHLSYIMNYEVRGQDAAHDILLFPLN